MRQLLIPALLLSLLAGCSSVPIGPHRIDVQQGNALDQENVARLKLGLNRSQVRFLLGTPLVVDPFRNDRWDYVYVYHKAGRLAEQRRITLFFEGDVLVRIEGDLPPKTEPVPDAVPAPATTPAATTAPVEAPARIETRAAPVESPPQPQPILPSETKPVAQVETAAAAVSRSEPAQPQPAAPQPAVRTSEAAATPAPTPVRAPSQAPTPPAPAVHAAEPTTSIVPPLRSPAGAPPYANKRPPAELALQAETDVEQIQPDVIPPFPEPQMLADLEAGVLASLKTWSDAWARRDEDAYLAAYDAGFVPQGGGDREEWEKRRRLLLGVARNIDLRIESPTIERVGDGEALVTFNQHYRSDSYRDSVVKQLRMVERDGRWLIAEERVLTILRGARQ